MKMRNTNQYVITCRVLKKWFEGYDASKIIEYWEEYKNNNIQFTYMFALAFLFLIPIFSLVFWMVKNEKEN
jgi:hypothetical protein